MLFYRYKSVNQISLKNKEKLQEEDCERYQNLSEEEKENTHQKIKQAS